MLLNSGAVAGSCWRILINLGESREVLLNAIQVSLWDGTMPESGGKSFWMAPLNLPDESA